MGYLKMTNEDQTRIFQLIAAILHLGNIEFTEDTEDCQVGNHSRESLETAADLLSVSLDALEVHPIESIHRCLWQTQAH